MKNDQHIPECARKCENTGHKTDVFTYSTRTVLPCCLIWEFGSVLVREHSHADFYPNERGFDEVKI